MQAQKLAEDIFLIPGFFNAEECRRYIELSESTGYEKAPVNTDAGQRVVEHVRNNSRILYRNFDLADKLWAKLKDFIPGRIENIQAIGLNELFRFYKYEPGQTFRKHRDQSYFRNGTEASYFTFMIYLNNDSTGGETSFNNLTVKPEQGSALVFAHELEHEGKPVLSGQKYVLRTDVMYRFVGGEE